MNTIKDPVLNSRWTDRLGAFSLGICLIFLLAIKGTAIYNIAFYLLLLLILVCWWQKRELPNLPNKKIMSAYIFFCICLLVSGAFQGEWGSFANAVGYVYRTMPFLLLYFGVMCFNKKDVVRKACIIAMGINAAIVAYWYLNVWDAQSRLDIVNGPNITVDVLSLSLIFGGWAAYKYRHNKIVTLLSVMSALLCTLGIWWTQSRGGIVGLLAGLALAIYCYYASKKWKNYKHFALVNTTVLLLGVVALMGAVAYLVPRDHSDHSRIAIYNTAWHMFVEHPAVGVGVDNFYREYNNYVQPEDRSYGSFIHAHNDFLSFLATTGILGMAGFAVFSFVFLFTLVKGVSFNHNRPIYFAMLYVFLAMYLHGLVDVAMCNNTGTRMVFGLLGVTLAMENE